MFVTLKSRIAKKVFLERLQRSIGPVTWRFGGGYGGSAPFIGSIDDDFLDVRVCTTYMNSFAPILYAYVRSTEDGIVLKGIFLCHPIVLALLIAVATFLCWSNLYAAFLFGLFSIPVILLALVLSRGHRSRIMALLEGLLCEDQPPLP